MFLVCCLPHHVLVAADLTTIHSCALYQVIFLFEWLLIFSLHALTNLYSIMCFAGSLAFGQFLVDTSPINNTQTMGIDGNISSPLVPVIPDTNTLASAGDHAPAISIPAAPPTTDMLAGAYVPTPVTPAQAQAPTPGIPNAPKKAIMQSITSSGGAGNSSSAYVVPGGDVSTPMSSMVPHTMTFSPGTSDMMISPSILTGDQSPAISMPAALPTAGMLAGAHVPTRVTPAASPVAVAPEEASQPAEDVHIRVTLGEAQCELLSVSCW